MIGWTSVAQDACKSEMAAKMAAVNVKNDEIAIVSLLIFRNMLVESS